MTEREAEERALAWAMADADADPARAVAWMETQGGVEQYRIALAAAGKMTAEALAAIRDRLRALEVKAR